MKIHLVYLMLISAAIFADSSENNLVNCKIYLPKHG